jgi:sulfur relay (sulfurtransferase) DsrF/TusC family protein
LFCIFDILVAEDSTPTTRRHGHHEFHCKIQRIGHFAYTTTKAHLVKWLSPDDHQQLAGHTLHDSQLFSFFLLPGSTGTWSTKGSNDDNKLAAAKQGLLEHDGVTHPFDLSSRNTPDNIAADEFLRAFLFECSVSSRNKLVCAQSLQKKGCPEHARLIRCTCVETSFALRDIGRGPIQLVYRLIVSLDVLWASCCKVCRW